jgi:3-oxoadipate enol-lactonase/4-carboxymuconolactone decarboxylase
VPDRLAYDIQGPEGAAPLLLLGSLGTTRAVWDPQLPELRQWFRVVRFEHPGHGGAGVPEEPPSVEALGRRLLALCDELRLEKAHVAGLSLGGLVGLWLAATRPERVERLAVCCATTRFANPEAYLQRAAAVRAHGTAHLATAAISRWFTPGFSSGHPEVASEFSEMLAGVSAEGYAYCCEVVAGTDLAPLAGAVHAPTLVLGAAFDPVVPPEVAAATMKAIPGSTLRVLRCGAHLVNVECPDDVSEALLAHFAGTPRVRGETVRRAVLGGDHVDRAHAGASDFARPFQEILARWPWGEIWARPGLDLQARRLLTIAILAVLGRHEELEMHIRSGLAPTAPGRLSEEALREVLLHCALYAGVPAANAAFSIAERVLAGQ